MLNPKFRTSILPGQTKLCFKRKSGKIKTQTERTQGHNLPGQNWFHLSVLELPNLNTIFQHKLKILYPATLSLFQYKNKRLFGNATIVMIASLLIFIRQPHFSRFSLLLLIITHKSNETNIILLDLKFEIMPLSQQLTMFNVSTWTSAWEH
jgi:hypothetical protein